MSHSTKPTVEKVWGPTSAVVARTVGILCIALGFVLGMDSLQDPESTWLRTSQALIVTGLLAQGYAMYCTIQRARRRRMEAGQDGEKRNSDGEP